MSLGRNFDIAAGYEPGPGKVHTNARRHLRELGAPEPELPPFDAAKYEPMPDVELNPKDEFYVEISEVDSGDSQ